jgi:hypothetical protein
MSSPRKNFSTSYLSSPEFLQFRNLANAFSTMTHPSGDDPSSELLDQLVEQLMASAEHPPSQVEGVSDEFLEQLERVPKKNLKAEQSCPICSNPFLEGTSRISPASFCCPLHFFDRFTMLILFMSDPHPLVVRLSCHRDHIFDLECITPWLKLNPTCPLYVQLPSSKDQRVVDYISDQHSPPAIVKN